MLSYVMRVSLYFGTRVGHRNCHAATVHDRQVDYIIAHVSGLVRAQAFLREDFFEHRQLVLYPLVNMFEPQIARTQGDRFRDPFRNQSSLDASQLGQRNSRAIVGVKSFGLDRALADNSEAALIGMVASE